MNQTENLHLILRSINRFDFKKLFHEAAKSMLISTYYYLNEHTSSGGLWSCFGASSGRAAEVDGRRAVETVARPSAASQKYYIDRQFVRCFRCPRM